MSQPIAFKTIRYRCPHCPRTGASKTRIAEHIGRCWTNPAARGCKTCEHYEGWSDACGCEPGCNWGGSAGVAEHCHAGVSLAGRPECDTCKGRGQIYIDGEFGGVTECPTCGGDGAEIKPGPIVHCDRWEADTDA